MQTPQMLSPPSQPPPPQPVTSLPSAAAAPPPAPPPKAPRPPPSSSSALAVAPPLAAPAPPPQAAAPSQSPTTAADAAILEAFHLIDKNGDGLLSRIEIIKACRADERIRSLLGLPKNIRQEDGTRDQFEQVFQRFDADDSKSISLSEFLAAFRQHEESHEQAQALGQPSSLAEIQYM